MDQLSQTLSQRIDECLLRDRPRLRGSYRKLKNRGGSEQAWQKLRDAIEQSAEAAAARSLGLTDVVYPPELPVAERRAELLAAIQQHQVLIVAGETGSGKTTQLPKLCVEAGRGVFGMIGHTQPRRLAARTVASRIASELNTELGAAVGYQVRFTDQVSADTRIKLMTDGILLSELRRDRKLLAYDTLIIDEAHERSLNIDFLLGYLKQLLPRRPDLKLIITSATIEVGKFSEHFDGAPVIEVSGRTYPVEVRYLPPETWADTEGNRPAQAESILHAVREIDSLSRKSGPCAANDILVFLSGEREIREAALLLRRAQLRNTEILPLYARLGASEQQRVFQSHVGRRIVLATNVAETSLTVPGIGYVIDTGTARISRYSVRSQVQQLPVERVSQASAAQRAGRCGRIAPGTCIRLYDEADFHSRPEFTTPEILRTNLAAVVLQMAGLGFGDIEAFPFLDAPDARYVRAGVRLLQELGALDDESRLTDIGRKLMDLPIDPQLGRMLLASAREDSLREILIIASALSIPDPRERPADARQAADEKHRVFRDPQSDFLSLVGLWDLFETQRQELTRRQQQAWCRKHFVSWMRMREWREVHRQLRILCRSLKLVENREPASFDAVHRAILSGLPTHVGMQTEDRMFIGPRQRRFRIFPDSALVRKPPKWILAAELMETRELYARVVARIDPAWIEQMFPHLLRRSYSEPHWSTKRGQVMALEQVTFYGLTLASGRTVAFGSIDPVVSREIFIREALCEGQVGRRQPVPAFLRHNLQLMQQVGELEDRSRRRDLMVDQEFLFEFYAERLPGKIRDLASLRRWLKKAPRDIETSLRLSLQQILQEDVRDTTDEDYPRRIEVNGVSLAAAYDFTPGQEADGVTLDVPVSMLRQLDTRALDWMVPGMLEERVVALMRGLPRPMRKNFVPVPDFASAALAAIREAGGLGRGSLEAALGAELKRMTGVQVPMEDWKPQDIDAHLQVRVRVLDDDGKELGSSRDLNQLKRRFSRSEHESGPVSPERPGGVSEQPATSWEFGVLAEQELVDRSGVNVPVYPALQCVDGGVVCVQVDEQTRGLQSHRAGIMQLLELHCKQGVRYLGKNIPASRGAILEYAGMGADLGADLALAALAVIVDASAVLPRDPEAFAKLAETARSELVPEATRLGKLAEQILDARTAARGALRRMDGPALRDAFADMSGQLDSLVFPGFMREISGAWLTELPRYLHAIRYRAENLTGNLDRDQGAMREIHRLEQSLSDCCAQVRARLGEVDPGELPWLLQELRVSLFAQRLGTRQKISAKRIEQRIAALAESA